jgi:hypothetical protein
MSRSPRRKAIKRRRLDESKVRRFRALYESSPLVRTIVDGMTKAIARELQEMIVNGVASGAIALRAEGP